MSRFREKVTVTLVTGQYLLDSNVAAGRQNPQIGSHMWNLVRMINGINYLVDVTNCDRGETGDDSMFMVGCTKVIRPGKEYMFTDRNGGNQYYIYDQDTLDLFPFGVLEVSAFDRDESRDSQAERMPGDVNADGIVDGRDVIELMKFIAGDDVEIDEAWGDVNADGATDAKDLLLLVRCLGGEKVTLK